MLFYDSLVTETNGSFKPLQPLNFGENRNGRNEKDPKFQRLTVEDESSKNKPNWSSKSKISPVIAKVENGCRQSINCSKNFNKHNIFH